MPDFELEWGIQETASGGQQLIDSFLNDEPITSDPKEVTPTGEEDNSEKQERKKPEGKSKEEDGDDDNFDINSLIEEEDDDDDNDEEGEPEEKDQSKKKKDPKKEKEESSNEEQDQEENSDDEDDEEPQNPFTSLSRDLIKLGVFEEDEELNIPESDQEFLERFNLEAQKRAQYSLESYLGRFGEDRQNLFKAIYEQGVEPQAYLESFVRLENYAELDLEKEANQEKVVRASMKNQGFDSEDIDTEVERLKEYGDLENVSKKYHKVLVRQESKKLEEQAYNAQQKLLQEKQKKDYFISSVKQILDSKLKERNFDGIPLTPVVKEKVETYLTNEAWKLPSGELISDFDKFLLDLQLPENYSTRVKIALLALNNFDLSKVSKTSSASSKEASELFESLASHKKKVSKQKGDGKSSGKKAADESDLFSSLFAE